MPKTYFDSFSGLVPVKVLSVYDPHKGDILEGLPELFKVRCEVLAKHGPYAKGEVIEPTANYVVPDSHIRRRKYGHTIVGGYSWSPIEPQSTP